MTELICQYVVLGSVVLQFFMLTYIDINGRVAKEPAGFGGFIGTCVAVALITALYYGAGAFDKLF